ncbi:unnamed protein product [Ectocarpus sp. 6 AP-2014]
MYASLSTKQAPRKGHSRYSSPPEGQEHQQSDSGRLWQNNFSWLRGHTRGTVLALLFCGKCFVSHSNTGLDHKHCYSFRCRGTLPCAITPAPHPPPTNYV